MTMIQAVTFISYPQTLEVTYEVTAPSPKKGHFESRTNNTQ